MLKLLIIQEQQWILHLLMSSYQDSISFWKFHFSYPVTQDTQLRKRQFWIKFKFISFENIYEMKVRFLSQKRK